MNQDAAQTEGREPPRFAVGIDLGTTNCAVAWAETGGRDRSIRLLSIPQLVGPDTVEDRPALPSFLYRPTAPSGRLPWQRNGEDPFWVVGAGARDRGLADPGRLIQSAKSWLSHAGVDRRAAILPWHGHPDVEPLSPVEASARLLAHIRSAWDHAHPEHPLAEQAVALTIPASFDEIARELTVEAAREAGLESLTLLEEPQAAFYAWMQTVDTPLEDLCRDGEQVLVCDVGGGTTDFTLLEWREGESGPAFHRVAVGDHLILGGDNLDLALAHVLEERIGGAHSLSPADWSILVQRCREAKERLLGADPPDALTIALPGGGARLVGGSRQVELRRSEVEEILTEGFLPRVSSDAVPQDRRSGFQEFSLPYAPDPAITRYLAAFLRQHASASADGAAGRRMARPTRILFNGGFFAAPRLRERVVDVVRDWFRADGPAADIEVLTGPGLDSAVARGAAAYGLARFGEGPRVEAGLAHTYYIGVSAGETDEPRTVCLAPAGLEPGRDIRIEQPVFRLRIREPVEFPLYISSTRTNDDAGDLVPADPDQLRALPPIRTVLQAGKKRKRQAQQVEVTLRAGLTEIGTLDVRCEERGGNRSWQLQFDVRAAPGAGETTSAGSEPVEHVSREVADAARAVLRHAFEASPPRVAPESVARKLDEVLDRPRPDWPLPLLRELGEALLDLAAARERGAVVEARWYNLLGFCLRPGFGAAMDDWRVGRAWKMHQHKIRHPRNEACRAEWWILWRRVAGGLTPPQQKTLAAPLLADLHRRGLSAGGHETAEILRLLASLEHLAAADRVALGDAMLDGLMERRNRSERKARIWSLGRLGSRAPVYGPLNSAVPPEAAARWLGTLCRDAADEDETPPAVMQLARRTGDRYRDLPADARDRALRLLASARAPDHWRRLVETGGELDAEEQARALGDRLPAGLSLS